MMMQKVLVAFAMLCIGISKTTSAQQSQGRPAVERRVESILGQMTIEEKIDLLGGINAFDIRGVPRLGVPVMATADGPFGIRRVSRSNVMAGGIALAATWNEELAHAVGREIGRDARARGVHFYLAPGVNIYRSPHSGRNFEYLGEDPFLASRIAVNVIRGVQSQGVAATVKHYLGNNSEFARHVTNAVIDERAAREIYLPAFEAAVKEADVAAVMTSYNLVNGEHMSASRHFNLDVLKRDWGFQGVLMSDWDATYDAQAAANAGLDLEMPSGRFLNREQLLLLLHDGKLAQSTIDDKVRRILRTAVRFGWLDREQVNPSIPRLNPQGRQAALQSAREGMVLLKNANNVLPLNKGQIKRIAIIGPNAYPSVPHGGGSATVAPFATVSFLEGLSNYLNTDVEVHYARGLADFHVAAQSTHFQTAATGGSPGLSVELFDNTEMHGSPVLMRVDAHIDQGAPVDFLPMALGEFRPSGAPKIVATRWTGFYTPSTAGAHDLFVQVGGFSRTFGFRVFVDDKLIADRWATKQASFWSIALKPVASMVTCRSYGWEL